MKTLRTIFQRYILPSLIREGLGVGLFFLPSLLFAQAPQSEGEAIDAAQEALTPQKKVHLFNGVAVGADLCGAALKLFGNDWDQLEVLARLNLYDKYFPIVELGIGEADHEGRELDNHFKVRAPYFRVGADYNFNKKHNGNRLFLGLRYGFSSYKYDFDSPVPLSDPVWRHSEDLVLHDLSGSLHWGEIVFGLETKLWAIVHLGWDVRIKFRFSQNAADAGTPWYAPGFGKTDSTPCFGGSFKLLFDI